MSSELKKSIDDFMRNREKHRLEERKPITYQLSDSDIELFRKEGLSTFDADPYLFLTSIWVYTQLNRSEPRTIIRCVFDEVSLRNIFSLSFDIKITFSNGEIFNYRHKEGLIRYYDDSVFIVSLFFTEARLINASIESIALENVFVDLGFSLGTEIGGFHDASKEDQERYQRYKKLRKRYMDKMMYPYAKSPFAKQYEKDGWKHFPDAVEDFETVQTIINREIPDFSENAISEAIKHEDDKGNEHITFCFLCTFDKDFFRTIFLLQNHDIVQKRISGNGLLELCVSVDVSNELLIQMASRFAGYEMPVEYSHKLEGHLTQVDADLAFIRNILNKYFWNTYLSSSDLMPGLILLSEKMPDENEWYLFVRQYLDEQIEQEKILLPKWGREFMLYFWFKGIFPDTIFQYREQWLEGQSIDIFIPSLKLGIEHQGKQHFQSVEHFGGKEAFEERMRMDQEKRLKCFEKGVTLIDWRYDEFVTVQILRDKLVNAGIENVPSEEEIVRRLTEVKDPSIKNLLHSYEILLEKNLELKSDSRRTQTHPTYKLCQFSSNGELLATYFTYAEASEKVGVSSGGIQKAIAGIQQLAGGCQWRKYGVNEQVLDIKPVKSQVQTSEARPVLQYSYDGTLIHEYCSMKQATKATGVKGTDISKVARGIRHSAGGYVWKFKE